MTNENRMQRSLNFTPCPLSVCLGWGQCPSSQKTAVIIRQEADPATLISLLSLQTGQGLRVQLCGSARISCTPTSPKCGLNQHFCGIIKQVCIHRAPKWLPAAPEEWEAQKPPYHGSLQLPWSILPSGWSELWGSNCTRGCPNTHSICVC